MAEELDTHEQDRTEEFAAMIHEIKRVGREVRDAKRFDVYKQLHIGSQEDGSGNIDSMGEQVIHEEGDED